MYPPTPKTLKLVPKVSVDNTELGDVTCIPEIGFL
jgi:hypothetical protein